MTSLTTLLALADSRLPTGGHVHSGGVEEAVTSGLVVDLDTLRAFLRRRIAHPGTGHRVGGRGGAHRLADVRDADLRNRRPHTGSRGTTGVPRTGPGPGPAGAPGVAGLRLGRTRRRHRIWRSRRVRSARPAGIGAQHTALSVVYTTMTGSATAAQRLLALDPGDVAALTFELSAMCDQTADLACKELADLSDPLLDVLAQRHAERERPLFAS